MSCLSCSSHNQAKFSVEMNFHFTGLKNIDKPSVWLFPEALVCLNCGFSQFSVPTIELALLAEGRANRADSFAETRGHWQAS